ncbi:MAG: transketolase family protein [SAR202 cluster bacterium]|nr:transketolase [Chloroflexota bacterium]MQG51005.1 transketolase family protein [SAR202 cluster bacterium]|tara:strand:+ start:29206 stop:30141 length:936 start_codon:yes stop_codon:yes gene_type:complete
MESIATREAFGKALLELGHKNNDIVVVGGDLNVSTFAHLFGHEFPDRFFDFGPAEQNIMSVAAGLASCGKIAVATTFAVFGTGRPFDQIRMQIAQPHANVKIVCSHAGLTVGEDGSSAQSIEDIGLMCTLPGFNVIIPSDGPEAAQAIKTAIETPGPFYIRTSRASSPIIHDDNYKFELGKAEILHDGKDATILACGIMVSAALEAKDNLLRSGIDCSVINLSNLSPLDTNTILNQAHKTGAFVTAEEHYIRGGLNSLVSQLITSNYPIPIEPVALTSYGESGESSELLQKYNLTAASIENAVQKVLQRKS